MLYLFTGTDREKARAAMNAAVAKVSGKGTRIIRISDANMVADLQASLQGAGMFGEPRAVILDGIFTNDEMRDTGMNALAVMKKSPEPFFILEEKPDAATRKQIEKYAESSQRYDAAAKAKDNSIFGLANALARHDKKALWTGYQRELAKGKAPEAIHGVLFWAAKDMYLKSPPASEKHERAKKLVAELAELPHETRRHGVELEYALELFVLR